MNLHKSSILHQLQYKISLGLLMSVFLTTVFQSIGNATGRNSHELRTLASEKHDLETMVKEDKFEVTRGLSDYAYFFEERFRIKLWGLYLNGGHWLDGGAGSGRALREFFENARLGLRESGIRITAVSVNKPREAIRDFAPLESRYPTQVRFFSDRYIEDIPDSELVSVGKADLITDVHGALAYSQTPDVVLNTYLRNLKDNGEIYTLVKATIDIGTKKIEFVEWLKSMDGLEITQIGMGGIFGPDPNKPNYSGGVFRIKKKLSNVQVPRLKLVDIVASAPPYRWFVLAK